MGQMRGNPGVEFLKSPCPGTPEELIQAYALFLLKSADAYRLPVPLEKLKDNPSLSVFHSTIPSGQRGFTTEDLRIYLNAEDLPTVQNFTLAHEMVELLFLALREGAADDWMSDEVFTKLMDRKEYYCEMGAAEILMPMPLFRPLVSREALSFDWARQVARRCKVSLTATLWRILETGQANALFIVWQLKHSTGEVVPSSAGQMNLFGPPEFMDPPKKMRIERVFAPPQFSKYIPKQKSVPLESCIHRAFVTGESTEGWDEVDLVAVKGKYFIEAVPFFAQGERRVMSLIHLDKRTT